MIHVFKNIGISYTLVVVFFLTKAVHNADLPTFSKIIFPYRYCIDDVKVLLANCWIWKWFLSMYHEFIFSIAYLVELSHWCIFRNAEEWHCTKWDQIKGFDKSLFFVYTYHVNMHSYSEYSKSKYVYMHVSILAVYTTVLRH